MKWWHPQRFQEKIPYLQARAQMAAVVRQFFDARGYLEVDTPILQRAPCMEAHIQAFDTMLVTPDRQSREKFYLHTSPEFAMKKLLVAGLPRIYQLAKVFRNAEGARWHSPEFTMLEWYATGMPYRAMMDETLDLVRHLAPNGLRAGDKSCDPFLPCQILTVVEALQRYAGLDIRDHLQDLEYLRIESQRIGVYVSPHDDWDNALLKILMEKVEPHLGSPAPSILTDYPVSMAALSRPKADDPRFAERFELYVCGIELANAFGELTDPVVQRQRFQHEVALRQQLYGDLYPVDEDFLSALEYGLPAASGNALGFDRLVMLSTGADHIDQVQAAPVV